MTTTTAVAIHPTSPSDSCPRCDVLELGCADYFTCQGRGAGLVTATLVARCDMCGRRRADMAKHGGYVIVRGGRRSELVMGDDGATVLEVVCTGHGTLVRRVCVMEDVRSSMEVLSMWGHGVRVVVEWSNHDAGIVDRTYGWLYEPADWADAVHLRGVDNGDRMPKAMSFPASIVRYVTLAGVEL